MINPGVNSMIKNGTHIYNVSSEKKTCKPGVVIGKSVDIEKTGLLVKLYDGQVEYVDHINGVEEDDSSKPGWYVMF